MELTRRHALAGAAAVAATPLLSPMPARAAAPVADKQAPSFYRYKVGDIQVTVVSDGRNTFPLEDSFVSNAKKEESPMPRRKRSARCLSKHSCRAIPSQSISLHW
jgi:hypothetical protein